MRVGERLDIGLASNPSTGDGWQVRPPDVPGAFSGVGPSRVLTPPAQPGGPPLVGTGTGQECFGLIANIPGTYTIFFRYARPFDPPTTPPARTKELTVIVVPARRRSSSRARVLPEEPPGESAALIVPPATLAPGPRFGWQVAERPRPDDDEAVLI